MLKFVKTGSITSIQNVEVCEDWFHICLIPQPGRDVLLIWSYRIITLQNVYLQDTEIAMSEQWFCIHVWYAAGLCLCIHDCVRYGGGCVFMVGMSYSIGFVFMIGVRYGSGSVFMIGMRYDSDPVFMIGVRYGSGSVFMIGMRYGSGSIFMIGVRYGSGSVFIIGMRQDGGSILFLLDN